MADHGIQTAPWLVCFGANSSYSGLVPNFGLAGSASAMQPMQSKSAPDRQLARMHAGRWHGYAESV